jgi:hypothetical protein
MLGSVAKPLVMLSALVSFVIATLACAAPRDDGYAMPPAQATFVRRTAVAEVQAIIANKSTATPVPGPTATPTPSCPDAIWWTEARSHTGESRTVEGTIVGVRAGQDGASVLEVGQLYPDPTGVAVVLAASDGASFNGKTVCATGRIGLTEGRLTLQLRDSAALKVVD